MSALINQLGDFISWLYQSAQTIIDFINDLIHWLYQEVVILQTVSNLVVPPALQGLLAFAIAFMIAMLVVKVVINLL